MFKKLIGLNELADLPSQCTNKGSSLTVYNNDEKITYLGNYPDIPPHNDEGIMKDKVMMIDVTWSIIEHRILKLILRFEEELGLSH